MYSKIALGNVKKSFKDYTIYFLTLALSVCIFYSFNSIESQKALMDMKSATSDIIPMLMRVISIVSVFVSVILGSLILYANNFLIKKRKKELGIYMTLGMGKNKISKILVLETVIVGIMSLISGLVLGLIMSQGLSIFTSKLFEVPMSEYSFVISFSAIYKTMLYFGIIFILVMLFNTRVISKYKIIDLLTAGKKNENIKIKKPILYFITFILSIISLGFAYGIILKIGFNPNNPLFGICIILGIIGTVLFFLSLAGFLIVVIKNNKKIYFKGLNMFILRQISSKINTNFLSMSVICLMLFITIGILSTGISFKNAMELGLEKATPFDASATMYINEGDKTKSIKDALDNLEFNYNEGEEYSFFNAYTLELNLSEILQNKVDDAYKKELAQMVSSPEFIKLSDYNKVRAMNNKKTVTLEDNEVILCTDVEKMSNLLNNFIKNSSEVNIENSVYKVKDNKIYEDTLISSFANINFVSIVMNDEVLDTIVDNNTNQRAYMNVNYDKSNEVNQERKYVELFNVYRNETIKSGANKSYDEIGFVLGDTRESIYKDTKGMTTTVLFIGIYLGIIFLIASMAVLALQQLSEASDSIERYKSLKRIGANDKSINKTIFSQIAIYFSMPILLSLIHSIVGIKVINEFISAFNKPDIGGSALITALVIVIVYVMYFYATYIGYKNIVKNN
ncbi:MAG: ABC transporter permease [Clostridium sp.]|nr:ABC transporter permease [Clostridium sp.]